MSQRIPGCEENPPHIWRPKVSEMFSVKVRETYREERHAREELGFSLYRKMENRVFPYTKIKSSTSFYRKAQLVELSYIK